MSLLDFEDFDTVISGTASTIEGLLGGRNIPPCGPIAVQLRTTAPLHQLPALSVHGQPLQLPIQPQAVSAQAYTPCLLGNLNSMCSIPPEHVQVKFLVLLGRLTALLALCCCSSLNPPPRGSVGAREVDGRGDACCTCWSGCSGLFVPRPQDQVAPACGAGQANDLCCAAVRVHKNEQTLQKHVLVKAHHFFHIIVGHQQGKCL